MWPGLHSYKVHRQLWSQLSSFVIISSETASVKSLKFHFLPIYFYCQMAFQQRPLADGEDKNIPSISGLMKVMRESN
jgi:hypothetical protein